MRSKTIVERMTGALGGLRTAFVQSQRASAVQALRNLVLIFFDGANMGEMQTQWNRVILILKFLFLVLVVAIAVMESVLCSCVCTVAYGTGTDTDSQTARQPDSQTDRQTDSQPAKIGEAVVDDVVRTPSYCNRVRSRV
jgi:hypothetical protein